MWPYLRHIKTTLIAWFFALPPPARYTSFMPKSKKKVAIFDIDGTIFRSSLLIELTDELVRERVFPKSAMHEYLHARAEWMDREGSYEDYIDAVIKVFVSRIKGVSEKRFKRVARRVVAMSGKRVYLYTRDLIGSLRKQGYYLLAISNSPSDVVKPFCDTLGFDKVYGRMYETDRRGRFTGKVQFLDLISDKSKILMRVVEKEKLTLKSSIGVGDSEADIPFLECVEKPICFNPNAILCVVGKKRGWKVVVERKDVVYEF
jgi:HAD superfamily hydrolase (TIGR01490 family)